MTTIVDREFTVSFHICTTGTIRIIFILAGFGTIPLTDAITQPSKRLQYHQEYVAPASKETGESKLNGKNTY